MPNTIVVAPTTAVPISTGLAVALKVFPAPSFFSRKSLAFSKSGSKPKFFLMSALMLGRDSIWLSSYTDCALSETGPKQSRDGHGTHSQETEGHQTKAKMDARKGKAGGMMAASPPCCDTL